MITLVGMPAFVTKADEGPQNEAKYVWTHVDANLVLSLWLAS